MPNSTRSIPRLGRATPHSGSRRPRPGRSRDGAGRSDSLEQVVLTGRRNPRSAFDCTRGTAQRSAFQEFFPPPAKPAKKWEGTIRSNPGRRRIHAVTDAAGKFEIGGLYLCIHMRFMSRWDPQRPSLLASSANSVAIRAGQTETTNFKLQTGRHVVGRVFEIGSNKPITRVDLYSSVSPNPKTRRVQPGRRLRCDERAGRVRVLPRCQVCRGSS